jgi:hypothetical protein
MIQAVLSQRKECDEFPLRNFILRSTSALGKEKKRAFFVRNEYAQKHKYRYAKSACCEAMREESS